MTVREKYTKLAALLRSFGSAAVAFSGGVDSTFLAKAAVETLGAGKVAGFTAVSASYPKSERAESERLAAGMGLRQIFFETRETNLDVFKHNPKDRCYHCKKELFTRLLELAREHKLAMVVDGSNVDDEGDYRPGLMALKELNIRSPLKECGFTKADIRDLSKELGLPTWNKPAFACLSSRFQYGDSITDEKLKRVEAAEELLRNEQIRLFRVRDHGNMVRIEVAETDIARFLETAFRKRMVDGIKALGYHFVSLDLEGYRTGSMNEVLKDARP